MKRLPVLVERALGDAKSASLSLSEEFDRSLPPVSCRKRCNNCCYHPVFASVFEGITLYLALAKAESWPQLRPKVAVAAKQTEGLAYEIWMLSAIPCPLLNESGECSGYNNRPIMCRTACSISAPEFCHPHKISESTGLVPRITPLVQLAERETQIAKWVGTASVRAPLAQSLLAGEAIAKGTLDISEVLNFFLAFRKE